MDDTAARGDRHSRSSRAQTRSDGGSGPCAARARPLRARRGLPRAAALGRIAGRCHGRGSRLRSGGDGSGYRLATRGGDRPGALARGSDRGADLVRVPPMGARRPAGARAVARHRGAVARDRPFPQRHLARADHRAPHARVDHGRPTLTGRPGLPPPTLHEPTRVPQGRGVTLRSPGVTRYGAGSPLCSSPASESAKIPGINEMWYGCGMLTERKLVIASGAGSRAASAPAPQGPETVRPAPLAMESAATELLLPRGRP